MKNNKNLYPTAHNPLLVKQNRPLPKEIAVIGAGTIGPDIAYYLKSELPSIKLFLIDVAEKPLEAAEKRLSLYAKKAVDRRKMSEDHAKSVLENIIYTTDYDLIKDCDLIIEAATESIPLKKMIFASIEKIVKSSTIITSNTSSIPADRLFSEMDHPDRATVTHFFAPAWRSLTVEIIDWEGVSRDVLDFLFWFFGETGKAPIMTDNALCFVLDRIFDNWCNEAAYLLSEATSNEIDYVAEKYVHAGPFFVLNMANGNLIIVETNTLQMEEGKHYLPAEILKSVDRWSTHRPGSKIEVSAELTEKISDRLLGILFSQSFDIVDRGIGTSEDLNSGCEVVLGFKKGPFDVMRELGEKEVIRIMDRFEKERPGFPKMTRSFSEYQNFGRYILSDIVDGVKILTIRRPQAMNALNDEIADEILGHLKEVENNSDLRGAILTGYGKKAFSAGADIGKFPEMLGDASASVQYSKDCAQVQCFMDSMTKPVVAALNGMALGGGFEVALRCHSIVALKKTRLQFPEISLGILPGIGGCVVPYRRWPQGGALFHEMITLGKAITVEQAADIGMVSKVLESIPELIQSAMDEVESLQDGVGKITEGPVSIPEISKNDDPKMGKMALDVEGVEVIRQTIIKAAEASSLAEALEIGYRGFGEIACTSAAKEGISSFLEKRAPNFR